MARRIPALVEPALLGWARDTAGYTIEEAAGRLKKDARVILAWEAGDDRPAMGQLRRLAGIYKRPLSDFYLPEPPEERPFPYDSRRALGEVALVHSPDLRRQLRLARERRDLTLSVYDELQEPIPTQRSGAPCQPAADLPTSKKTPLGNTTLSMGL
jgi:transcriptional regulator with XRE-family HTH domain